MLHTIALFLLFSVATCQSSSQIDANALYSPIQYTTAPIYATAVLEHSVVEVGERMRISITLLKMAQDAKQFSNTFDYNRNNDVTKYKTRITRVIACEDSEETVAFHHDAPHRTGCYTPGVKRIVLLESKPSPSAIKSLVFGDENAMTTHDSFESYVTEQGKQYNFSVEDGAASFLGKPMFASDTNNHHGHGVRMQVFWEVHDGEGSIIVPENKVRRDVSAVYTGGMNTFQSEVVYHTSCKDGYTLRNYRCEPLNAAEIPVRSLKWTTKFNVGLVFATVFMAIIALVVVSAKNNRQIMRGGGADNGRGVYHGMQWMTTTDAQNKRSVTSGEVDGRCFEQRRASNTHQQIDEQDEETKRKNAENLINLNKSMKVLREGRFGYISHNKTT